MSKKRKLTLQQRRRIAEQRRDKANRPSRIDLDSTELGALQNGLIAAHYGTEVLVDDDSEKHRCFFRSNLELAVGDNVLWRPNTRGESGVVESREERSSFLQRPDSYGSMRTVGANISQIIITIAPEPEPHASLIDRYLVSAEFHQLRAVILLNKSDLIGDDRYQELLNRYLFLGYPTIKASASSGEGISELQTLLRSNTSIFVGQSGVGKSSLVKALIPDEDIRIGELSQAETKGRHTTTHSQLYRFTTGGLCIDSPGIREFGLWHTQAEDVLLGFKEIYEHASHCKFRDCRHDGEPGCAVALALNDGSIHPERFKSYKLIINQLSDVKIKTDEGLRHR